MDYAGECGRFYFGIKGGQGHTQEPLLMGLEGGDVTSGRAAGDPSFWMLGAATTSVGAPGGTALVMPPFVCE